MEANYKRFRQTLSILFILTTASVVKSQTTQTFVFTGAVQNFTVPSCVAFLTVEVWGAQGTAGTSAAGLGGAAKGVMSVTAGQVLSIFVGGQAGFNGGGLGVAPGGNGGGATDIRVAPATLQDRVIVAGGGGGGGATNPSAPGGGGGAGFAVGANFFGGGPGIGANSQGPPVGGVAGGLNGGAGGTGNGSNNGGAGGGGGLNSGGIGGVNAGYITGQNGALGLGGNGGGPTGPGGGGGGYYGGGGASGGLNSNAGGGGGSSWTGTLTSPSFTPATRVGNGFVRLTYNFNGNGVSAVVTPTAICTGSSATLSASGMVSYTWSTGSNASSITVNPNITTTYTATGTNSVGCISSQVVTVVVSPGFPVLSVTSTTNSLCLGTSAILTASGALSYTWTNGVTNGVVFTPSVTNTYTVLGENGCGTTSAVTTITVAPLPISAISTPTSVCAGSPATLTAVSPGTSYTWQPFALPGATIAVNPTVTTVYTVTTSNGTCSGVTNLTLNVKPVPSLSLVASSSVACAGDQIFMSVSGGLSYTWNPGNIAAANATFIPLTTTLYSVVGTNSLGCTALASQVVLALASPTINVTATSQLVCSGDPVTLTASGGNNFVWNPGNVNAPSITANPTSSTVYSVVGGHNLNVCTSTVSLLVNVYQPTVSLITSTTAVCNGISVGLSGNGGNNYQWSTGQIGSSITVNPASTTIYTLTATSGTGVLNCITIHTTQISVFPNPSVTITASRLTICKNESSTLTAAGATTYSWTTGSNSLTVKVTPSITTNYSVTGIDANGCQRTATVQIKVNTCNGIEEMLSTGNGILIYPNPNNGEFMIEVNENMELVIYNELGQVVQQIILNEENYRKTKITNLSKGIYLINGKQSAIRQGYKIIVEE